MGGTKLPSKRESIRIISKKINYLSTSHSFNGILTSMKKIIIIFRNTTLKEYWIE